MECLLFRPMIDPDYIANIAAYQCTKTVITPDDFDRLMSLDKDDEKGFKPLRNALKSGHYSVLEHANFTFYVYDISRVTLAQLTRHRVGVAYSVSSQRYTDIIDTGVVIPTTISDNEELHMKFLDLIQDSKELYKEMVEAGVPKEDARYSAVEGTTTSLLLTMNARELLHFFELRCCNRAQWEIRELADQMLSCVKQAAPIIFENAGPSCVTEGVCHELKSCGTPRTEDEWTSMTSQ